MNDIKKVLLPLEIPESAVRRIVKVMTINLIGMSALGIIEDLRAKEPIKIGNIAMGLGGVLLSVFHRKLVPKITK